MILKNDTMHLQLADPTAPDLYYRGQRFTLPGMVIAARWKAVDLFTEMGLPDRDPEVHDHVGGTAEEFDMQTPPDYNETPVGGAFMKIGVGLLRRETNEVYRFSGRYHMVQAPNNLVDARDRQTVVFSQTLREENGDRGYRLVVMVGLQANGFTISRGLENLGRRSLETEHYSHNFIQIGGLPVGPDYRVHWSVPLEIAQSHSREDTMLAQPTGVSFAAIPSGHYHYTSKPGSGLPPRRPIQLEHQPRNLRLRIGNDRPLHRLAIWGEANVICPEPFVKLHIAPGETVAWTTTYTIGSIDR